jgi:nicotinamidase-related amidase
MPARNLDLHGKVPDKSAAALVLIDVINDMNFDLGERLLEQALPAARAIAKLKRRAAKAGIPCIYVNDYFGRWRSDLSELVEHCLHRHSLGAPVVKLLRPTAKDYVVLKPKHSGFYATVLDVLLQYLGVKSIILAGFATDVCVYFTANDAYQRDFKLLVPSDCCASSDPAAAAFAMGQIERVLQADVRPSPELDLAKLARQRR